MTVIRPRRAPGAPLTGCRWCGIALRDHGLRCTEPVGWHRHTAVVPVRTKGPTA